MKKLQDHLVLNLRPNANKENIVFWKDYRVTVLSDRLFRIEKNENKIFRDKATQIVWYRDMPKQEFTSELTDKLLSIKTNKVELVLLENIDYSYIVINGEKIKISNKNNLMGTYRTLDRFTGDEYIPDGFTDTSDVKRTKIQLETGICSTNGVAYFDDSKSLTLDTDGEIKDERGQGLDYYVFAYGKNYRESVKALYMITGEIPLVPRFALGNWWSRYHEYTDREYLQLLNRFEENDIPLSVATIDMDWHYSNMDEIEREFKIKEQNLYKEEFLGDSWFGWTGYTWNKNLFKDYQSFLKKVKDKNLKITMNLHPATGVRFWDTQYEEMAKANNIDPKTKHFVPFDFTSNDFINSYFAILHKPYEKDGVDFWWIDWQQGFKTKLAGLDPLWALNHYHYLDNKVNHSEPLILSRYSGIGAHRYPIGFSGDTFITWETLKYLPYFTLTASNVGYTWWSHDIGGHMCGYMDEELYLRQVQFGVFSPINRLHCTNAETMTKEPWYYGNGTGEIAMKYLRLRHKMIPWLYTLDYKSHKEGKALIEPLYYEYPDIKECYTQKEEYFFGDALVGVVTSPLKKDGFARVKMFIPKGKWTDFFTGDEYEITNEKGEMRTLLRKLEAIPVLVKEGSVIPLSQDKGNLVENPHKLEVLIFNGNGEFTLYEDKANEDLILKKSFTNFRLTQKDNIQTVEILNTSECNDIIPNDRKIKMVFKNLQEGQIKFFVNGKQKEIEEQYMDNVTVIFDYDPSLEYKIVVEYPHKTKLEKLKERAVDVLLRAEGNNDHKRWDCYGKLKSLTTIEEYIKMVDECPVTPVTKQRLKETL
ncbi:MAG: alpha-xylosidase [Clostridia bacterium]|nr:alpha-xylosidase [Clostridia bacterium]